MKALQCEMCGSQDMVKQDGMFVCQHCGTKYSVEEAKKMMIEGTVDVSGSTVKIDTSDELVNLYKLARRAKNSNDTENAKKYYEMIVLKDISNWEPYFYSTFYKAMSCKIDELSEEIKRVGICVKETFLLIKENITDFEQKKEAILEIIKQFYVIRKMFDDANTSAIKGMDKLTFSEFKFIYLKNLMACTNFDTYLCDGLCEVFIDDEAIMNTIVIQILKKRTIERIDKNLDAESKYVEVIKKYDKSYEIPQFKKQKSSGCYVATAVYGSYDCPEVWTLRRFRDYTLAESVFGRLFIRTYYAISPTLVKWFGKTEWFKNLWKPTLDKMVKKLNAEGVEDTPYEDKIW